MHENDVRVLLVTNSHPDTLALKDEVTGLAGFFDAIYTSHEFGYAKERQEFWYALQEEEGFLRESTLFVDDNHTVLESADTYGVEMLVGEFRAGTRFHALEVHAELLDEKRHALKRPRRQAAFDLTERVVTQLLDHAVQIRIETLDRVDRAVHKFARRNFAPPYEIGEAESVTSSETTSKGRFGHLKSLQD